MERNPLSSVDGNALLIPISDRDEYHCLICNGYVPEDEWNSKRNCCYSCFWKI